MAHTQRHATVAVAGPLRRSFIYRIPPSMEHLEPGQRVLGPFGSARKIGFYLGPAVPRERIEIKELIKIIDQSSLFSKELFKLCRWMADYYFANPADCFAAALPSLLKTSRKTVLMWGEAKPLLSPSWIPPLVKPQKRVPQQTLRRIKQEGKGLLARLRRQGIIVEAWPDETPGTKGRPAGFRAQALDEWNKYFESKKFRPEPFDGIKGRAELKSSGWTDYRIRQTVRDGILEPVHSEGLSAVLDFVRPKENVRDFQLTREQQAAFEKLRQSLDDGFSPTLLHGVTGSGKTIVYCHISREVLRRDKTVLVLTPEIALAGTTLAYFRGFFGDQVTVVHSAMTERERLESWRGIRQGKYKIVVGPRSAVFAPLPALGLIIVDEEHDGSYKQDDPAPRFHGRDCAIMRAKINDVPVLLGSASPSIESFHHACSGRYRLLRLTKRPGSATLPLVRLVDMRTERVRGDLPFFSYPLKKEVQSRLKRDEQVILYLNRRGHSPQLKCADCGYVPHCPHCRVNLTYHKAGRKLSCHYCGFVTAGHDRCSKCGGSDILYLGAGTQKVEETIPRLFEGATAVRFDSDSAAGRTKAYRILSEFAQRKYNLLLGTQMVTKGLDLPGVTLVGVLAADLSLDFPDFRASEKTFAQLLQVAGRSGRAERPGEVLIQTYYPDSDVINDAAAQDYQTFYEREIRSREQLLYPPFLRLVNCILSSADEKKLESSALSFRDRLSEMIKAASLKVDLLGPAPCPLYYLRGRYRRHLIVKTRQVVKFVRMLTDWENRQPRFKVASSIKVVIDVDPDDMM